MAWRGVALLASAAALVGPPAAHATALDKERSVYKPAETADAALISEGTTWNRYLHHLLRLPTWLDVAVDHRTRYELLEEPFRPGEPESQDQCPQRTRLRLGLDRFRPVRFLVELQDARTSGDGRNDFTGGQIDELDVLQLFASATSLDFLGSGLRADVHAGRLTLDLGSRRLVARNRFRNTTNAFDGIHGQIGGAEHKWRTRAFFTLPVPIEEGVFDDEPSSDRLFWGLAHEDSRIAGVSLNAYYLGLDDRDRDRDLHTIGLRGHRPAKVAAVDYEVEVMGQFGDVQSREHSAFATHAEIGYTLAVPASPRLALQFDCASGTEDPNDDESHTFDPLFGARRFDLNPTGIFGPFRRSNILSPGGRFVLFPVAGVEAHLKVRYWELAEKRDAFVGTGLRDPTGAAGDNLGTDLELRVRWSPTPWWSLDVGYDHWFKGSYLDRVPDSPSSADSDYFYAAVGVRI